MSTETINQQLDEIEAEFARVGITDIPAPESLEVRSAFGFGEMAFEQWLVHVFMPNARAAAESGNLPANSQVGIAAMRSFDGDERMTDLITLLAAFDQHVMNYSARNDAGTSGGGMLGGLLRRLRGR